MTVNVTLKYPNGWIGAPRAGALNVLSTTKPNTMLDPSFGLPFALSVSIIDCVGAIAISPSGVETYSVLAETIGTLACPAAVASMSMMKLRLASVTWLKGGQPVKGSTPFVPRKGTTVTAGIIISQTTSNSNGNQKTVSACR